MGTLAVICISSGVATVVVATLLSLEKRAGRRFFLSRARAAADTGLLQLGVWWLRFATVWLRGVLRHTFHYVLHKVLQAIVRLLDRVNEGIRRIMRTNKRAAKAHQSLHIDERLQELQAFSESIKLSPEERRQKRHDLLK